jgi:hypothetical protein
LKRGTLVGETTGGGANPGSTHRLDDHFNIFVPDARARNPITMTNWEGTGVVPDVAVPADRALVTAYGMALDQKLKDPKLEADDRETLKEVLEGLHASDDSALLTEPSDHVNSATAKATEDVAMTARVSDFFARSQSGDVDRTQLSARFFAFLTQKERRLCKGRTCPKRPRKARLPRVELDAARQDALLRCSLRDGRRDSPDGRLRRRRQDRRILIRVIALLL